ncbi:MAG: SnoaL-like domain-containing protein [Leptolyngbyaceae cyanobacterium SL_5_9]|nr:SnoaL-like domain-containing protein [Leptolyngbyaceae cyanobacterium SL_5_9]
MWSGFCCFAIFGKSEFCWGAIAQTPSTEHPNVAIVQRYYQAYGRGDLETVREIFAPDITWTIPGHHPLAGTKRGVDEVLAFFDQLAKAQFRAEVLFLGGNDNYVVDVHRGWSNLAQGENIDELWALLFRIESDRIAEAINFPGNQHAADTFFWKTYSLKPIPARLMQ